MAFLAFFYCASFPLVLQYVIDFLTAKTPGQEHQQRRRGRRGKKRDRSKFGKRGRKETNEGNRMEMRLKNENTQTNSVLSTEEREKKEEPAVLTKQLPMIENSIAKQALSAPSYIAPTFLPCYAKAFSYTYCVS